MGSALIKLVLTNNGTTKTYDNDSTDNRIRSYQFTGSQWGQSAEILVDNSEGNLTNLELQGYDAVISRGYKDSSQGDEYSAKAPMKVLAQNGVTFGGKDVVSFAIAGLMNFLAEDHASADYIPDSSNTDTVKTIANAVMGVTLAPFSHCTAYTITWDSEDSLIDSFIPADNFRISYGETRLSVIKRLFGWTKCVIRFEADGNPHVLVPRRTEDASTWIASTAYSLNDMIIPTTPNNYYYVCTTAGTSDSSEPTWTTGIGDTIADNNVVWTVAYHYEYTRVSTDHNFYDKGYRRRSVFPPKWIIESHPDSDESYTGSATDSASFTLFPGSQKGKRLRVASNAQATSIAEALIAQGQAAAEQGYANAPMNVGQEFFDYVNVIDAWSSDYREGNIRYISERYIPDGRTFQFEFRFGSLEMGGFVGTLPPNLSVSTGQQLSLTILLHEINRIYGYIGTILDILEDHERRITALEEKTEEDRWVTLFDGSVDTPSAAAWAFEAGLPFTATGQIYFSPLIQEVPLVFVVYVIDEGTNFWKYNITNKNWTQLTNPNYSADDAHRTLVPDDVDNPKELWCAGESPSSDPKGDGVRLSKYTISTDVWTDSAQAPHYSLLINGENRVGTFSLNEVITGASSGATAYIKSKVSEIRLWVAPISTTQFTAGEEIEGGTSGATMDILGSEGFGSSPNFIYGDEYCSIAAFVYVSSTEIRCWVSEGPEITSTILHKCILYNPTADTWTVGLNEFTGQRFRVSCASINAAGTIVYGGGSTALADYVKYTIAGDSYAHTTVTGVVFSHASDKDKLPFSHLTTVRQGYVDTSDDSVNGNQFAENPLRSTGYGRYFGVDDSWTYIIALAKDSSPELMSVVSGGTDLLGTINSKNITEVRVLKPNDNYMVWAVDTETNNTVYTDHSALLVIGEGVWNVYYPTAGDHTGLLIQYKGT